MRTWCLDYVDLYIKKGTPLVKLSLRETIGDEEKLKTLGRKAVGRFCGSAVLAYGLNE